MPGGPEPQPPAARSPRREAEGEPSVPLCPAQDAGSLSGGGRSATQPLEILASPGSPPASASLPPGPQPGTAPEAARQLDPELLRTLLMGAAQAFLNVVAVPGLDAASLSATLAEQVAGSLQGAQPSAPSIRDRAGEGDPRSPDQGAVPPAQEDAVAGVEALTGTQPPSQHPSPAAPPQERPPPVPDPAPASPLARLSPDPDLVDPEDVPDHIYSEESDLPQPSPEARPPSLGAASPARGQEAPCAVQVAPDTWEEDVRSPDRSRSTSRHRGPPSLGRYAEEQLAQVRPGTRAARLALVTANRWAAQAQLQSRMDAAWAETLKEPEVVERDGLITTARERQALDRRYGTQVSAAVAAYYTAILEAQRADAAAVAQRGGSGQLFRPTPQDSVQKRDPLARLLAEGAVRQHLEDHLCSAAAESGYALGVRGRWTLICGADMYWNPSVRLGPPIASSREELRHKELWFLLRWKADLQRVVRRLCRRSLAAIRESARKYEWGPPPDRFVHYHANCLRRGQYAPSARELCKEWAAPFVQQFWVWQEEYVRQFPEVLGVRPGTLAWKDFLTPYSMDFHEHILPLYERYLKGGGLASIRVPSANIPRSGNVAEDIDVAITKLVPPELQGRSPSDYVAHTVPMEAVPGAAAAWRSTVGLSLVPWGNEPRPRDLTSLAHEVRLWPRRVARGTRAPSSSSSEGRDPPRPPRAHHQQDIGRRSRARSPPQDPRWTDRPEPPRRTASGADSPARPPREIVVDSPREGRSPPARRSPPRAVSSSRRAISSVPPPHRRRHRGSRGTHRHRQASGDPSRRPQGAAAASAPPKPPRRR